MAKSNARRPPDRPEAKPSKLNWSDFNFLENLLIHCSWPTRSVPAESGVKFHIHRSIKRDGLCVVYQVDRQPDELVVGESEPRPDWLVAHLDENRLLLTIVEMKGRNPKGTDRGIEQIVAFHQRLKREVESHLPKPWRRQVKMQGVLLTPPNASLPLSQIDEVRRRGLVILPLQCHHDAELYPYVRRENSTTDRYQQEKFAPDATEEFNPLEQIVVSGLLPQRLPSDQLRARLVPRPPQHEGVHVSAKLPGTRKRQEHALLSLNPTGAVLGYAGEEIRGVFEGERARLKLDARALQIVDLNP